jgi:ElaB/YqjD/DUF883 family membrane-anchored ribosome-binding protein
MVEANANAAQNDMKSLNKDANNLLNDASATFSEKSADIRNKGAAMMDTGRAKAKELQASAIENSKKLMRTTNDYVQSNPWGALAISAGVGLLLGFLFKRK